MTTNCQQHTTTPRHLDNDHDINNDSKVTLGSPNVEAEDARTYRRAQAAYAAQQLPGSTDKDCS